MNEIIVPLTVEVGKKYLVPCITNDLDAWLPIIGPPHRDGAELCQHPETPWHVHIDRRFLAEIGQLIGTQVAGPDIPIVYREMTCWQETSDNGTAIFAIHRLTRMFQNHVLDLNNPVCPHNKQVIVNPDGKCPGHGLCWNMQTGRLKYKLPFYVQLGSDWKHHRFVERETMSFPIEYDIAFRDVTLFDAEGRYIATKDLGEMLHMYKGDVFKLTTNCAEGFYARYADGVPGLPVPRSSGR